ncbi:MAG TPA: MFS transporter [Acidimicrobiales bacterium]|nr:MFS transporter [Acidimicrobiales bacterium]
MSPPHDPPEDPGASRSGADGSGRHQDVASGSDPDELVYGAGGGEEFAVVPWPLLLRERVHRRARESDRYRWLVLAVTLTGLLSSNILFTVFVVALPKVASSLHTTVPTVTWVVTGPLLAVAVMAPLAGKLSDRWGHRRFYLIGMVNLLVVATLSAAAPNVGVLIFARVLGGAVGAGLGASSMALVLGAFDRGDRVKAMGWWSLVGAGGPVLGVAVGGSIIQTIGWRWMFVLEVFIGAVALVLALLVLPEHASGRARTAAGGPPLDVAGAVLVITCVGSLLFGLNRGPVLGWRSSFVVGAFIVSGITGIVLVLVERRVQDPLVPLKYLSQRNFAFPIGAQMFSNFAYLGGFFLSPLLLEEVYGHGESAAGLLVIPRPLTFSLVAPIAGYVAVRIGERSAAVTGTLCVMLSMGVFALTGRATGVALVEVALVLSGIGLGVASPSIAASMANVFDQSALGTAAATQQLMTQISTVAGIQVIQTVQSSAAHGRQGYALLPSFHVAFIVGGIVAVGGVICAAFVRSAERPGGARAMDAATGRDVRGAMLDAGGDEAAAATA